jgi:hypothetical protein
VEEHRTALPARAGSVDAAAVALGLPGFVLLAADEYAREPLKGYAHLLHGSEDKTRR